MWFDPGTSSTSVDNANRWATEVLKFYVKQIVLHKSRGVDGATWKHVTNTHSKRVVTFAFMGFAMLYEF